MTRFNPTRTALLAVLTLGALAATAAANAGASASEPAAMSAGTSVRVNFRDLDLATDAGNQALYQRISRAAQRVCAVSDIRDLNAMAQSASCERAAVSQAVSHVHSERLAALAARAEQHG